MRVCMSENELKNLQLNMVELNSDVKHIKEALNTHIDKEDKQLEEFRSIVKEFTESADRKYAPIITWNVIVWAARIIGGATIVGIATLIIRTLMHVGL